MSRKDVHEICKEINQTSLNKKNLFFLFSYSSLDEYINGKSDGIPHPVDIIVRTGGEKRLSDFLLCNAAKGAMLAFVATKWPMFSKFHMLLIFLKYRIEKSLAV